MKYGHLTYLDMDSDACVTFLLAQPQRLSNSFPVFLMHSLRVLSPGCEYCQGHSSTSFKAPVDTKKNIFQLFVHSNNLTTQSSIIFRLAGSIDNIFGYFDYETSVSQSALSP